ncbi:TldD/PmbA family protein [Sphingomonas sp. ASV193]|uniref:TldD/PmbA family protein n=1 Tax=Sphingomonas sp. ASV193 TaxID=3144405 RepID=UPI0032E875A3
MLDPAAARDAAAALVDKALKLGADAADAAYVGERSSGVGVRLGALEDVQRSEGEEMGLRVFVGRRNALVGASNLADLDTLAERAIAMAREAPEDPYAGLAPRDLLFTGEPAELDLDDRGDPDMASLRERALAVEAAARAVDGVTNSSGGSASASASTFAIATSDGFAGATRATGYSCSASVVAGEGAGMQRDYGWHSARHLADLEPPEAIGRRAGERAVARLNPRAVGQGRMAVLFDPRVATSLLGHLAAAINGASVARKSSFLQDRLGERIFAAGVTVVDDPLRPRGLRSRAFDGEGLPVARRALIEDGVLTGWFADSAAARQLGIQPTGSAIRGSGGGPSAGPSNLFMAAGPRSREDMIAGLDRAILVTELIGQGVNGVTGDYSRGASGLLVERGEIVGAVSGLTIASNLFDMFAGLEPASDLVIRRGIDAPTILVPEMTVA